MKLLSLFHSQFLVQLSLLHTVHLFLYLSYSCFMCIIVFHFLITAHRARMTTILTRRNGFFLLYTTGNKVKSVG
jgi:hypothetical protein